jgi:hypothetical protein
VSRGNGHAARHDKSFDALDELVADYLLHHPNQNPSDFSVQELINWAAQQRVSPTEPPAGEAHHNGIDFGSDDARSKEDPNRSQDPDSKDSNSKDPNSKDSDS